MVDKELVKDIVGRPRWWLINVPIMVVFLVVVTTLSPEDADGAVPPAAAQHATR